MTAPDPSPPAAPERKRFPIDTGGTRYAYWTIIADGCTRLVVHDAENVFRLGLATDAHDAMLAARHGFKVEIDESVPEGVVEVRS